MILHGEYRKGLMSEPSHGIVVKVDVRNFDIRRKRIALDCKAVIVRRDLDLTAEMHQERSVGNANNLDPVDVVERRDDLLVVRLARGVHGDIPDQKILADADDVDAFDIAAGPTDGGRDLAELSRFVMDLYAKSKTVTRVRCRCVRHI